MEEKDKQTTIIELRENSNTTKDEFLNILKSVAPGTLLRSGIDGIVDAKKGGLIVIENPLVNKIIDGGFKINDKFTPQKLIELAKMDGAIILSPDKQKVTNANVTLAPDIRIKTQETGTRHKAAERTAKMTGTLTIAISERKNRIHLYYKDIKYHLRDKAEILTRATETLQIMEKQRELFDLYTERLNYLEILNDLNLLQACKVIQKGYAMKKILESQESTLIELGNEAIALKFRMRELMKDVEKESDLVIKDYTNLDVKKSKNLLGNLNYEELTDIENVMLALAQNENNTIQSIPGWRTFSQTCLDEEETRKLLEEHKDLNGILNTDLTNYEKILGNDKAIVLKKEVDRIKNN